jgi:hypothetical protein
MTMPMGPLRWAYLLAAVVALAWCAWDFSSKLETMEGATVSFSADALALPEIAPSAVGETAIARYGIWDMEKRAPVATKGGAAGAPGVCSVDSTGGAQTLLIGDNGQRRWEFFGVMRQGGERVAIFRNPAATESPWRTVPSGNALEEGVVVGRIGARFVEMICLGEEGDPRNMALTLFRIHVDLN